MNMWLKVTLLLIYLAILFILARFLEAVTWYDQGQLSRRLLDPMTLSVLKLKALLEQRGVSYDNVVEKSELTQLVEATGPVSDDEVSSTTQMVEETVITNYTCGLDFIEQVEDNKDSMWLVEVIVDTGGHPLLSEPKWLSIRKKISKFGVRFGRFDCNLDKRMCIRKGWYSSRLVLALPENHESKSSVILYSFPSSTVTITSLFDWMKSKIDRQIETINDFETFQSKWLTFDSHLNPEVRVVFSSRFSTVPMFLSALSVKFPGRVKIGSINSNTPGGKDALEKGNVPYIPSYLVLTPERRYYYGANAGETFSFKSMELFLKSLHPSLNDIFIVSMIFTNALCCFEICLSSGTFMKRLVKLLWCVFKYNMVLMLVWIGLLAIFQLPLMEIVSLWLLKLLRCVTILDLSAMVRKDILVYSSHVLPLLAVFVGLLCFIFYVRLRYVEDSREDGEDSDWMNFSNMRTLQYTPWRDLYVSPFDRIFNPGMFGYPSANVMDQEQPFVSRAYIKTLPTWRFQCDAPAERSKMANDKLSKKGQLETKSSERKNGCSVCQPLRESPSVSGVMDGNYECDCLTSSSDTGRNGQQVDASPHSPAQPSPEESESLPSVPTDDESYIPRTGSQSRESPSTSQNLHPSAPKGFLEDTQCVICLESYLPLVMLCGLPCHHVFHQRCVHEWLLRDNHFCPVCRWPAYRPKTMTTTNLHDE